MTNLALTAAQQDRLDTLEADQAALYAFPILFEALNVYIQDRQQFGDLINALAHIQEVYTDYLNLSLSDFINAPNEDEENKKCVN